MDVDVVDVVDVIDIDIDISKEQRHTEVDLHEET